jgi:DNA-directed RNA polymerase subunit N (RpoN/RPB10)
MEEPSVDPQRIRRSAEAGARTVTWRRQVVADAGDAAVQQWENAVLAGRCLANAEAWAYRVGANAARTLLAGPAIRRPGGRRQFDVEVTGALMDPRCRGTLPLVARAELRTLLRRRRGSLVGRQWEVVQKLTEPGMSLHRAAKELGMDRTSLRRCFRSALRRLGRA